MDHIPQNASRRKCKLPFSAVLLYLLLIALLLSGVTFSRYMTGTTVGDSARVAYMKDITISEEGNFTKPNEWIITPGVNMQKQATVHFEGSEMACYVFLRIETTGWVRGSDNYSYVCRLGDTETLSWSVDSRADKGWSFLSGDDSGAVYYRIVRANTELTAPVLANEGTITVSNALTRTQLAELPADMAMNIEAIAMQYYGLSDHPEYSERDRAAAAWELVRSK